MFKGEYKLDKIEKEPVTKSYSLFWRLLGWKNSDAPQAAVAREEQGIAQQLEAAVRRLPQAAYEQISQFNAVGQKQIEEVSYLLRQQHIANDPAVQEKKLEVGLLLGEKLVSVISQLETLEAKSKKAGPLLPIEQMQQKILTNQKNYLENAFIQLNRSDVDNSEEARLLSHEELLNTSKVRPLEKELLVSTSKVQSSRQAAGSGLFQRRKAKAKTYEAKKPSVLTHGILGPVKPAKMAATTHQTVSSKLKVQGKSGG